MSDEENFRPDGWHSRGYLPHFDGGEIPQTITFRLYDSLPQAVLDRWRQELARDAVSEATETLRRRVEYYLDQGYGSSFLKDERIASMVQSALLYFDRVRYRLIAWVIMPNHVHLLASACGGHNLSRILHSIKSYTAQEANRMLNRHGQFWMKESFDRYIRDIKHFTSALAYIENNPVKAGLCHKPQDWPYSSARFRAHE
jgi:REP element-mobilizing transposase RayT